MNPLNATLWVYGLTIVFALAIAVVIQGMGALVKILRLDRDDQVADLSIPSSNSMRENELLAVVLAATHARRQKR